MHTILWHDAHDGTWITFKDLPHGESYVTVEVAVPFGKHTVKLDLDEIDHLLAVREASTTPSHDIAEYLHDVHNVQWTPALRAGDAFVACAGSLAETVR